MGGAVRCSHTRNPSVLTTSQLWIHHDIDSDHRELAAVGGFGVAMSQHKSGLGLDRLHSPDVITDDWVLDKISGVSQNGMLDGGDIEGNKDIDIVASRWGHTKVLNLRDRNPRCPQGNLANP